MAEGLLAGCELPESASKLGKCHVCAAVDESYTIAQRSARLPTKQKVLVSSPGGAA